MVWRQLRVWRSLLRSGAHRSTCPLVLSHNRGGRLLCILRTLRISGRVLYGLLACGLLLRLRLRLNAEVEVADGRQSTV